MHKRIFWSIMCFISILNGVFFYQASSFAMKRGTDSADNQGALLFIPVLWIMAAAVLFAMNLYTLIYGRKIENEHRIQIRKILNPAERSRKEITGRIVFLAVTCLLMFFGYSLFAADRWSAAYALSGGLYLICLYVWQKNGTTTSCC